MFHAQSCSLTYLCALFISLLKYFRVEVQPLGGREVGGSGGGGASPALPPPPPPPPPPPLMKPCSNAPQKFNPSIEIVEHLIYDRCQRIFYSNKFAPPPQDPARSSTADLKLRVTEAKAANPLGGGVGCGQVPTPSH